MDRSEEVVFSWFNGVETYHSHLIVIYLLFCIFVMLFVASRNDGEYDGLWRVAEVQIDVCTHSFTIHLSCSFPSQQKSLL
jgi:hypothetical protein